MSSHLSPDRGTASDPTLCVFGVRVCVCVSLLHLESAVRLQCSYGYGVMLCIMA